MEGGYSKVLKTYFTRNVVAELKGEKCEALIDHETSRLLAMVHQCEKYKKYRERRPQDKEEKNNKIVWPHHLEGAFIRALVRWPPCGRKKHMVDGKLRGRNEMLSASIEYETGAYRDRKQISSHLQVLKNYVAGEYPEIMAWLALSDSGRKKHHHGSSRVGNLRSHQFPTSQSDSHKYAQRVPSIYSEVGQLPSSAALAKLQSGQDVAPYTVSAFEIYLDISNRRAHEFTRISPNARLSNLQVLDTTSWHKQFPELNFHSTAELAERHVLVCDASIKLMTIERFASNMDLHINLEFCSQPDLSTYDSLETRTRFYASGKLVNQWQEGKKTASETRSSCVYQPDHRVMCAKFGSGFWAHQVQRLGTMLRTAHAQEDPRDRAKIEAVVRKNLQYMTASQDIYGVENGEAKCFLTILWRFSQTRSSEPGRMTWRVVNFTECRELQWVKGEHRDGTHRAEDFSRRNSCATTSVVSIPTSTASIYPSLPLEFQQPFVQPPPHHLELDRLALDSMASADYSNPDSATAPSFITDYSQAHSLPSLSHSQSTLASQPHDFRDANEFDFNGGHITISGCLEPAINFGAYENYTPQSHQQPLSIYAIAGLEAEHHLDSHSFNDLALDGTMPTDSYATKPNWCHANVISHLESAAESYGAMMAQHSHGRDIASHGVLHNGQLSAGCVEAAELFWGRD